MNIGKLLAMVGIALTGISAVLGALSVQVGPGDLQNILIALGGVCVACSAYLAHKYPNVPVVPK